MSIDTNSAIRYVTVTPVCDTSAYGAGDTIFDITAIALAARGVGIPCLLDSIVIIDKDDQTAAAMTLWFFDKQITTFGTANAAPSISDADAASALGYYTMASGSFLDLGGVKVAYAGNLRIPVQPTLTTQTIYFAATCAGTPTQTAAGLVFRFGFRDA